MQTTQHARTAWLRVATASAALRGLILPRRALDRVLAGARARHHGFALIILIMLAILFASASVGSAQEPPSLRAAPPPESDVLRAAPDPGAVAQEQRDIVGRWLGATDAAIQSFAKVGGPLTDIVTGKFDGLSKTIAIADAASTLGAASAGDVRGAVSGAAAIAVGGKVTAGGAALFGEIGSVAGGAVGSFFPVIGNIAGSIVGGAVGTAAGGFICAFGYDKYVKDYVAQGITGIVSVFDTAPLTQAMQAKRAFLWETMAPEERAQLQGFNPEEVQLLDFATLPYVLVPKQPMPDAAATDAQDQAALPPPSGPLSGVRKIKVSIGSGVIWEIDGNVATSRQDASGPYTDAVLIGRGAVSGVRIDGFITSDSHDRPNSPGCHYVTREEWPVTMIFNAEGGVSVEWGAGQHRVISRTGTCSPPPGFTAPIAARKFQARWEVVR